ncbi:hypothetical protein CSB20_07320 [bacterium DOLZORAL124_64_63]|nr:MAG: hypothetical protein CSB20_07320 [bacterium DOLZORAL124_64_63]
MKRYLQKNRFELDAHEKEHIWNAVRNGAPEPGSSASGRISFRPALGLSTVTVALLAAGLWWLAGPRGGPAPEPTTTLADNILRPEPEKVTEVEIAMGPLSVAEREISEEVDLGWEQDAVSKRAEPFSPSGNSITKGGILRDPVSQDRVTAGSVTGGTTPPNGQPAELMYFDHTGVNPFVATEDDSLSTFAVDVDNASYTIARRYLTDGNLPPEDAIRVEEFVNAFAAGYERSTDQEFGIHLDGAPSRFGRGYHLVRVGLQGMDIAAEDRKPANLVFLIDVSGSMSGGNRLGLVKRSLHVLLDELREGDRVGIIVYGDYADTRLPLTGIDHRERIREAIDALDTGGSTNAYDGLRMAFGMAREGYEATKINRIILCSDGVANMGSSTEAEEMLKQIRQASDEGITLSAIGFGMGNYNDVLMEKLADQGDGNYYYVDGPEEAERVFRENLTGLMQTIARQVKVQVAFKGQAVQRWRLLGYENRDVADRDFRNDDVDAGEVGAGHQVTALYELKLATESSDVSLGVVRTRYELPHHHPQAGQVREISRALTRADLMPAFDQTPPRYRLQAVAAEFAEILRGSYWAKESTCADLVPVADAVAAELVGDEQAAELARLIRLAADLEARRD